MARTVTKKRLKQLDIKARKEREAQLISLQIEAEDAVAAACKAVRRLAKEMTASASHELEECVGNLQSICERAPGFHADCGCGDAVNDELEEAE